MWGAVIGDIAGSIYEFNPIKTKDFKLFQSACDYTDDSVCTAAVADILMQDLDPARTMQAWCRRHPGRGYGGMFMSWINEPEPKPYGSFGNGSAMRVSPAAYCHRHEPIDDALAASDRVTEISHNHPEGLKGARATVHAIWLALSGEDAEVIREIVTSTYGYDLSRSVDDIRPNYYFNEICQETVPEAITCALESSSFEDALRNAISLGGDADTLAAISGPIAEGLHGIPADMQSAVKKTFLGHAPDIVTTIEQLYEHG